MSDFMADLATSSRYVTEQTYKVNGMNIKVQNKGDNMNLDMTDFLQLMITQLTNQGIDDSMDTSDMLNQMVQMQMVTALANMTDASIMSYGASLVGKEVTVAKVGADGKLEEYVGTVTGTGTMNGKQVIVIDDEYYYLSEILAVGKLPPPTKDEETEKPGDTTTDPVDPSDPKDPADPSDPKDPVDPSDPKDPVDPDNPADPSDPAGTQTPQYNGQDGVPGSAEE